MFWWHSGLYDMTMLRFEQEKRVGFREYMRSDGTRSYFFCLDTVRDLFVGVGFIEVLVLSLLLGCCKQLSLYSRFLWCMCSLSIRPAWLLPSNWNWNYYLVLNWYRVLKLLINSWLLGNLNINTLYFDCCINSLMHLQLELEYCCVKSVNRRKGKSMQRVWVHGKFQKPA
jgi:hypothetical protein